MKKYYQTPNVSFVEFENDIITNSNTPNDDSIKTEWDFFGINS